MLHNKINILLLIQLNSLLDCQIHSSTSYTKQRKQHNDLNTLHVPLQLRDILVMGTGRPGWPGQERNLRSLSRTVIHILLAPLCRTMALTSHLTSHPNHPRHGLFALLYVQMIDLSKVTSTCMCLIKQDVHVPYCNTEKNIEKNQFIMILHLFLSFYLAFTGFQNHLSQSMTNQQNDLCIQQRLKSAWASVGMPGTQVILLVLSCCGSVFRWLVG